MTDPARPEVDAGPEEHPGRSGIRAWTGRLSKHKGAAVFVLGVALAGVSSVVGVAHVAWQWIFVAACAVAAVAGLATGALEAHGEKDRTRKLWAALTVACAVPVVAFGYHTWWDPSRANAQGYQVIVGGGAEDVFYLYDEPGGVQDNLVSRTGSFFPFGFRQ